MNVVNVGRRGHWRTGVHHPVRARHIDGAFWSVAERLEALWRSLPTAPPEKASCSARAYFATPRAGSPPPRGGPRGAGAGGRRASCGGGGGGHGHGGGVSGCSAAMPHMRFLHYASSGSAPHVDLSRVDPFCVGRRSAHLPPLPHGLPPGQDRACRLPRNDDGGNGGGQGGGDNDQNDGDNLLAAVARRGACSSSRLSARRPPCRRCPRLPARRALLIFVVIFFHFFLSLFLDFLKNTK